MRRAVKNLSEIGSTALDLISLRYPPFVYGMDMRGLIPVFCFHGVEPESFEAMLRFLGENHYRSLHADEYYDVLTGARPSPERAVVLTFDDGWGSLWSLGFPMLKKHDAKVVVFIPPGRIESHGSVGLNLDDLEAGRCPESDVLGRDRSERPLLGWEEIAEMHESGLVDFQSHSHSHSLVYRSAKIVDFAHPRVLESWNFLELPCREPQALAGTKPLIRPGEPLFQTATRLSDVPRLLIDPRIADACSACVESGGSDFFRRPSWRAELNRVAGKYLASGSEWPRESLEEQRRAIRHEVTASKTAIEEMLPGKVVRHLAYPWHEAGSIAVSESKDAGYASNFWGKVHGRYYTTAPADPFQIARVGGDFLFRLPGKGRLGLARILLRKALRRARTGSPYLTH